MSTYDQLHVCNMALAQAGSSVQLTTLTYSGTTPQAAALCLLYWDLAFDATANAHDWKCLTARAALADTALTGTVSVAAGTPTTVAGTDTLFSTELVAGQRIQIGDETRIVAAIASDTSLTVTVAFEEEHTDEAATRIHRAADPVSGYDAAFYLPDDFIRMLACDAPEWTVEGERLLTNTTSANIVYIARVLTGLSPGFLEALVLRLAAYLALALTFDPARKERAEMWLQRVCLPMGRYADSRQQSGRKFTNTSWLESRN
jgi:hypothetical protein